MRTHQVLGDDRGFTLIEVLVAAAVVVTGLLGVITMIDAANATSITTKARQQGVGVTREVLEAARSIPYAQLTPAGLVAKVQAMPGLANANAGPGWTIRRGGVTYAVSLGVCSVDDSSDGYGREDPNFACADMTGTPSVSCSQLMGNSGSVKGDTNVVSQYTGSLSGQRTIGDCGLDANLDGRVDDLTQADASACANNACQPTPSGGDSSPDDYKRLTVLVAWQSNRAGYVRQTTVIINPGIAAGPTVSSLGLQSGFNNGSLTITSQTTDPQTGQPATSVPFSAVADSNTVALQWSLNGTPQGSATNSGGTWTFNWPVGSIGSGSEVLDGNYTIGVIPFDSNGNAGSERSITVTIVRRPPYAPTNLAGGHNGSIVDFQWSPNKEGDVTGYQVYRVSGAGPDAMVCSTGNVRSVTCQDTNPPGSGSLQYYVVALDNEGGTTQIGNHSATLTVSTANQAPNAPTNLQASTSNGNTVLIWTPPSPADADGDQIDFYRIYRDGQALSNRYDTAPGSASSYVDTQTGGVSHTYWVTAVDPQLAESLAAGPVTR